MPLGSGPGRPTSKPPWGVLWIARMPFSPQPRRGVAWVRDSVLRRDLPSVAKKMAKVKSALEQVLALETITPKQLAARLASFDQL